MYEALVQHAEHDVDRHCRCQDQPWLTSERASEFSSVAGIAADDRFGHADIALRFADRGNGVAKSRTWREIEADRRRGKLLLMTDGERSDRALHGREGTDRHLCAVSRRDEQFGERAGTLLVLGHRLQDYPILIGLGIDR